MHKITPTSKSMVKKHKWRIQRYVRQFIILKAWQMTTCLEFTMFMFFYACIHNLVSLDTLRDVHFKNSKITQNRKFFKRSIRIFRLNMKTVHLKTLKSVFKGISNWFQNDISINCYIITKYIMNVKIYSLLL